MELGFDPSSLVSESFIFVFYFSGFCFVFGTGDILLQGVLLLSHTPSLILFFI